mgnify:CR=1 FL=1
MRRLLLLAALLPSLACATSSAFRAGEKAERVQDYDRAVMEYSKAVQKDPGNAQYLQALGRARLRASTEGLEGGGTRGNHCQPREGREGAVLKHWVETRFGLLARQRRRHV